MTHFFDKRDPWGHGIGLWVLVGMVFLTPLACWSVKQIDLKNDVAHWLPSDDPQAKALEWYEDHFSTDDHILISWKSSSLSDPRVGRLAERLEGVRGEDGIHRNGLKYVKQVLKPHDVIRRMLEYKVEPEEAIRRLQGVLLGAGMMKLRLSDAGRQSKQRLVRRLVERAKSELGIELKIAEADSGLPETEEETATADVAVAETEDDQAGQHESEIPISVREHDLQIGWRGVQANLGQVAEVKQLALSLRGRRTKDSLQGAEWVEECFFQPGSPLALLVTLSEAGKAETSIALQAIREAAAEVGIAESELHLGGRPVAGSALNQQVKKAAWNRDYPLIKLHKRSPLLLSAVVGVLLAFAMLRSFRLATLVLIVANYTTLLAVALVPITHGSMNMVLVVMPTLLSVLTISAAIHVANYWRHAACRNMRTAIVEATKMAGPPCALASATTAIGLISLVTSPLAPVRDFGFYSAVGCLISLLVVMIGLPALLQYWPSRQPIPTEIDRTAWKKLAMFLTTHRTAVSIVCLGGFAVCTYGLKWFHTETKIIRYFPDQARIVRDYNFLEENLAGIVPVETIVRFDEEAQRDLNFLERMELVRAIQSKMRAHPEISGSISLADFQPISKPPGKNARFLQRARYNKRAHTIEARVKGDERNAAKSFLAVASRSADLHEPGDRKLSQPGDELWRITAQVAIMSEMDCGDLKRDIDEIAKSVLKLHPGAGHLVTGMVPVLLRTQQAVLQSLIRSFGLAFAVIVVVMILLLKNPLSGLISMLPNLLPVGVVFGLISWNGVAVDIGMMITASVGLGIAVDGTLHLLTWFRAGISKGMSRSDALGLALAHCGPAMSQTSASVGIGLLMLYPADLLLISRFGWLMGALIAAALAADLVFLPALLAGPLGRLIEKTPAEQDGTPADVADHERRQHVSEHSAHRHLLPHLKVVSPPGKPNRTVRTD